MSPGYLKELFTIFCRVFPDSASREAIETRETVNWIHIYEYILSLYFLYYARINQLLKTMMCNVATFCSHFMVFKILKKASS